MDPQSSRDNLFRQVVVGAVTSPVSLFLGSAGLLLSINPVTWPAGLAFLAAEAGWLWTRIRDPRAAQACSEERRRRQWSALMDRLEDLTTSLDPDTASALASIVESQERLTALAGGDGQGRAPALHSQAEQMLLLQHCVSLAEKRYRLYEFLRAFRPQDVQRQVAQLQHRIETTPDPVTRELYQQAVDQKRQELENYVRLEDAVGRIDGQLAAVQCTFDNMMSRLVAVQTAQAVAPESGIDPVSTELSHLTARVAHLEASLEETLAVRAGV